MPKIKNMGTATMRFNEGVIVSGSVETPKHAFAPDVAIVSSGTLEFSALPGVQKAIRILSNDDDKEISFQNSNPATEIGKIHATPGMTLIISGANSLDLQSGIVLINSGGAASSPDPTDFTDANFFVSGSIDSRGTGIKGTSVFGGDLVVSGTLSVNRSDAGGFSMVTVTTDGKVGIGTDNPGNKLSVGGNMDLGEYLYHKNDQNTFIRFQNDVLSMSAGGVEFVTLEENSSQPSNFFVNKGFADMDFSVMGQGLQNMDLFYVDASDGNVGIGTQPDEDYKLHISGSTTTAVLIGEGGSTGGQSTRTSKLLLTADKGNSSVTGSILVQSPGGSFAHDMQVGTLSDHNLEFLTNNAERVVIRNTGDVGIGNSSPEGRLHIMDTDVTTQLIVGNYTSNDHQAQIATRAGNQSNNVQAVLYSVDTTLDGPRAAVGTTSNHQLDVQTNNTTRITVKNSGNVTIEKDLYVLEDLFVTGSFKPGSLVVNHPTFTSATGAILIAKEEHPPALRLIRSSSAPTTSVNPDDNNTIFGSLTFNSEDDTYFSYVEVASIEAVADGANWNYANNKPTALVFKTGQENSISTSERMRITSEGRLSIGRNKPSFDLHLEDTGSVASFGMVRRHRTFAADDELGSLSFGAVGGDDDGLTVNTVAHIKSYAESAWTMPHNENELFGFSPSGNLTFVTRESGSSAANAAILTGDRELQVDTIAALATNADQKIQWRNSFVAVPFGGIDGLQSYDERLQISGSIRYAKFSKAYAQINGTETTIPARTNLVQFNPDGLDEFKLKVGGDGGFGDDVYFYVSGSTNSRGTNIRGTATFGGDVVVSGSLYDSDGDKYAKSNKVVAYGSISLQKNGGRTVSFDRQTSLGDGAGGYASVKSFLFAPFNGIVSKIIVNLKSAVDAASHGIITVRTFKNADGFGSASSTIALSADSFSQVNAANPTVHKCTFESGSPLSISEGDLLQFTVSRNDAGTAGTTEGVVMIILEEDF